MSDAVQGQTALMYAAGNGHVIVAHMLLSQGSSPSAKDNMVRLVGKLAAVSGLVSLQAILSYYRPCGHQPYISKCGVVAEMELLVVCHSERSPGVGRATSGLWGR